MNSSVNFVQPDITLRLDLGGIIRRAELSNVLAVERVDDWVGRPWEETVVGGGLDHVRKMVADARTLGVSSFHQVRQRFQTGRELAIEYTTVRLGGQGGLLAIGRNLEVVAELRSRLVAAQASMERDYWKLREVETRYRLLFDSSTQPVLLVQIEDLRIAEANPAAIRALGVGTGSELIPEILPAERGAFRAMLGRVHEQGKAPGLVVHLGNDRSAWLVRASLVAAEPAAVFVLQLSPSGGAPLHVESSYAEPAQVQLSADRVALDEMIARLPDAFVVIDPSGRVVRTNRAFLSLVEEPAEASVVGERLERWLSHPSLDAGVLFASLQRTGATSQLSATIEGERGTKTAVVISAAGSSDSSIRFAGLTMRREVVREGSKEKASALPVRVALDPLGAGTLREIIQEKVAAIERQCIEAALTRSKGNRSVAAQKLGLSRQSLYTKLNRYSSLDGQVGRRKK